MIYFDIGIINGWLTKDRYRTKVVTAVSRVFQETKKGDVSRGSTAATHTNTAGNAVA